MKLKIFDVVELKNGDRAIIIEVNTNNYKAKIVNAEGKFEEIQVLREKDIRKILIKKD